MRRRLECLGRRALGILGRAGAIQGLKALEIYDADGVPPEVLAPVADLVWLRTLRMHLGTGLARAGPGHCLRR
jgi:hypothetical protein